jgi:hypothetical protein
MDTTSFGFAEPGPNPERKALTEAIQELLSEFPISSIESAFRTVRRDGMFFAPAAEIVAAAAKLLRSKADITRSATPGPRSVARRELAKK